MLKPGKICPQHLERQAYVYIRQSTPRQMEQHQESQDLQYQLQQRAEGLGWAENRVVVIDDDLGKSAITASNRPGFQAMVTAIGLSQVGIILVTDVSRLARNCADWYQLLDLASLCGTLIGDASGVYDPREYNDRLLLGLKGTFSEAQWYHMRMQLYAALLNKARRGELAIRLPEGYERTDDGEVVFSSDLEVQNILRLIFAEFARLGSARAVLLHFRQQGFRLPRSIQRGPDRGQIEWVKASYHAIYRILKQPAYAGAYTYGKRQNTRLPGAERKVVNRALPIEKWAVLILDAFPGYISWEQYLKNQDTLRQNAQGVGWNRGAARNGVALLQGIVLCGCCGRRMHARYSNQPAYVCEIANKEYGEPICQYFPAAHIDAAVRALFLEAVQPAHLDAALAALEELEIRRQQLTEQWQQRLQRSRYEADLARRRYEQVDPDNRLVAAELEKRWEEKLRAANVLEQEWERAQTQELRPIDAADRASLHQLAKNLPALWQAETTTNAERKRLLRSLVDDITLDGASKPGISIIHVRWQTGTTTTLEVERPKAGCRTAKSLVRRISKLAEQHADDHIADILNADGVRTATGKSWNRRRVANVRKNHDIPTGCPYYTRQPGPRGDGLIPAIEAAKQLQVSSSMISHWHRQGLIIGHQRRPNTALWVRLTKDDYQRLNGSVTLLQDEMIPLPQASAVLGMTTEEICHALQNENILAYRIRNGKRWQWYLKPAAQAQSS
jgi:DNA invertase Pin-like site-specific DNA recombinase